MSNRKLLLIVALVFVVAFAYGESHVTKSWGLATQVSHTSNWIGAVFHLGQPLMIRPGFISAGNPSDDWTAYGLKCDFLFTGQGKDNIMWYIGPGILGDGYIDIGGGALDININVGVKVGVQAMISPNVAFFIDLGIEATGNIYSNEFISEGRFDGIYARGYGLGAVIYIK